jgi:hypothetical protein
MAAELPHLRPGLYLPRPHQVERMAAQALKDNPPDDAQASTAGRVLAHRTIPEDGALLSELVALCSPIKGALGISKDCPGGQLGPGWSRVVSHGFGIRSADGAITESVILRLVRGPRVAQWMWTRPVPHPALMVVLGAESERLNLAGALDEPDAWPIGWPLVAAVLRALPTPSWKLTLCTAWTTAEHGGPDDIPRRTSASAIKAEVRS